MKNKLQIMSIIFLIALSAIILTYSFWYVQKLEYFPANAKVGSNIGVNVDNDQFWFGTTKPGGASTRNFEITNPFDNPVLISITAKGGIAEYFVPFEQIELNPRETAKASISVAFPENTPKGEYNGTIRIAYLRR